MALFYSKQNANKKPIFLIRLFLFYIYFLAFFFFDIDIKKSFILFGLFIFLFAPIFKYLNNRYENKFKIFLSNYMLLFSAILISIVFVEWYMHIAKPSF